MSLNHVNYDKIASTYNERYETASFKGTYQNDLARFPSVKIIEKWMIDAGFEQIKCSRAERIIKPLVGDEVFKSPFLQKHNSSQLILLSDEAYVSGLNRIKDDLRTARLSNKVLTFEVDISLMLVTGIVYG